MTYQWEGDAVTSTRVVTDPDAPPGSAPLLTIGFRAEDVVKERTGVHARIDLAVVRPEDQEWRTIEWGTFNVEKPDDRLRIANKFHEKIVASLNGTRERFLQLYPKAAISDDLGSFARGLWSEWVAMDYPEDMEGDEEPKPIDFILEPYVMAQAGTMLFAPPGRGKSWVTLLMAVSIDAGVSYLWPVKRPVKVLFINLERSRISLASRLGAVNRALGLPGNRRLSFQNARGRSLMDVLPSAQKFIRERGVELVFLDSISRAGAGDLVDNMTANKTVDALNRLGVAWVGIGHTPRADENHMFGSMHFDAGADLMVRLISEQADDGPLGIGLDITKSNDIGKFPIRPFALEFDKMGFTGFRPAKTGEFATIVSGRKMSAREQVIQYILDQPADDTMKPNPRPRAVACASEIQKALGFNRSNVSAMLNSEWFVRVIQIGRDVYFGVAPTPGSTGDAALL